MKNILLVLIGLLAASAPLGCSPWTDLSTPLQPIDGDSEDDASGDTDTLRDAVDDETDVPTDATEVDAAPDADVSVNAPIDLGPEELRGVEFEARMSRRALSTAGESQPYDVVALFQGNLANSQSYGEDCIRYAVGYQPDLGGSTFKDLGDTQQGTIVTWITPEWDLDDLGSNAAPAFFNVAGLTIRMAGREFAVGVPGTSDRYVVTGAPGAWQRGEPLFVALRWDAVNPIGVNSHVSLSVGDLPTAYFHPGPFSPPTAGGNTVGASGTTCVSAASAGLSGFTVYRRPLFNGSNGVDMGNDNELQRIRNGADPAAVTGSWDVVFALPPRHEAGSLGEFDEAWTHPHRDNLLGRAAFFVEGDAVWLPVGDAVLDSGPADQNIFQKSLSMVTEDAGDGAVAEISAGTRRSLVVRAVVHTAEKTSDGPVPAVEVSCDDEVLDRAFGSQGTGRTHPSVLTMVVDGPDDCSIFKIRLHNVGGQGAANVLYWQQVEAHWNRFANGGMNPELGTSDLPGWSVGQDVSVTVSHPAQGPTSNANVVELSSPTGAYPSIEQNPAQETTDPLFFSLGASIKHDGLLVGIPGLFATASSDLRRQDEPSFGDLSVVNPTLSTQWQRTMGVGWLPREDAEMGALWLGRRNSVAFQVDDAYLFPVSAVEISVKPSLLERSFDADTKELRIDGDDRVSVAVSDMTATTGRVRVALRSGPMAGASLSDGSRSRVFAISTDAGETISLLLDGQSPVVAWSTTNDGESESAFEDLATPLAGNALQTIELSYDLPGEISLVVGGEVLANLSQETPEALVSAPSKILFGGPDDLAPIDLLVEMPIETGLP